ncbi:three-Cys-motif partner protein TcmP [Pseudonocardia sp. GCM10023141]
MLWISRWIDRITRLVSVTELLPLVTDRFGVPLGGGAGLPANDTYFQRRKPAAAFKHGILSRYPVVFAAKTGAATAGQRVMFLDGYAGAGQYDDESPGSPLLFMEVAKSMGGRRAVTGVFVEADEVNYQHLAELLAEITPPDASYTTVHGELGEHLHWILRKAADAALFVFLDPFGTALDRPQLCHLLTTRPRWPPTEVLLHFSVSTVARIGGIVRKAHRQRQQLTAAERKTVANVDRFLGGDWWQAAFRTTAEDHDEGTATQAALDVANRYCTEIGHQTGFTPVAIPVRPAPGRLPKYVLVLFTRHPHGLWHFTSTLGQAGRDWMAAHDADEVARLDARDNKTGTEALFDLPRPPFDPTAYERTHRGAWIEELADNLADLLHEHGTFRPAEHTLQIYGNLVGQAWEQHVRAAVKKLHAAGITHNTGKKIGKIDFWERPLDLIIPAQAKAPATEQAAPDRHADDYPTAWADPA